MPQKEALANGADLDQTPPQKAASDEGLHGIFHQTMWLDDLRFRFFSKYFSHVRTMGG